MKSNEVVGPRVSCWFVSILLLSFSANCSVQNTTVKEPVAKEVTSNPVEQSDGDNLRADNSFCYVCHLNYDGEQLTADHEQAGIGCAECHGRSYDHCGDENNITPPETMYPVEKINPFCMSCHPETELNQQDAHEPILSDLAKQQTYCTVCHGKEHRMSVRNVRWNKTTGELLDE
ncbi:MAG: cytochrome c3 family protein [Phycisphaerales bacterium]|nr:MAG: cytochrome c3 family protein [Phycisphaerales bacterium]UCF13929.1 MAG: cytochrome c3 family protein [Phycisphaerales bacterium]